MGGGIKGNLGAIYAGRFVTGLGVGQTPVVGPIYIAEIAPTSIRGPRTCFFTGAVYIGIVLAYFTNYGCAVNLDEHTHKRWLVPTSLHIMMSGIIFILTFFQYESPRPPVKQGKPDKAAKVMARPRRQPVSGDYVLREIATIQAPLDHELEATKGVG
ncbi:hypothetical protein FALCPG4_018743 [Fusarium falciforme]